jgi:hypothetical protein
MKSIVLISIMVILLTSICSATITTTKYYDNGLYSSGTSFIETHNNAIVGIIGGDIPYTATFDSSTVNIYGGKIGAIWITDNSTVNFFGGDTTDYTTTITVDELGKLVIFGYDFNYFTPRYAISLWGIQGKWGTGIPFEIVFRGTPPDSSAVKLYHIPEPSTIIFLGIGLVCFNSKRKVKSKSGDVGRSCALNNDQ